MSEEAPASTSSEDALIDLAVDAWRFCRASVRIVEKLDAGDSGRFANQVRYFQQRIIAAAEAAGLKFVNLEGHQYDPGIAATALNMDEFGPEDELLVESMIEPIVIGPGGIRREGTVLLKKRT